MPEALPVDWEAIKLSAVAGIPFQALATSHGLVDANGKPDTTAIRQRASREDWPIPSRVQRLAKRRHREAMEAAHKAQALAKASQLQATSNGIAPSRRDSGEARNREEQGSKEQSSGEGVTNVTSPIVYGNSGELGGENGSSEALSNAKAAVTIANWRLENCDEGENLASQLALASLKQAPKSLPVTSPADAKTLLGILRTVAGKDKPETAVQVNLFGPASAVSSGASSFIELDAEPLEEQEEPYNEAEL